MTAARHIHATHWGCGPRLVLLHGWTMRGEVMGPLAASLPGFACVAPDLPGHGGTTGYPADLCGAEAMLSDLLSDGVPTVLVGWSLGALMGWHWLARHGRGPVRGMISLDMSPRPLPGDGWAYPMSGQSAARIRSRADWFRRDWMSAVLPLASGIFASDAGAPAFGLDQARRLIGSQNSAVMAGFWSSLIEADCREAVCRLPVPLLAVHGEQSRVYPPACADWLAQAAPRGKALRLMGAGHAPHLERTSETAAAIAAFACQVPE
ncbi:pimeloyl-[acyl-carrier protein] methyl ester esterase [Gemmobacter megaterium]|uniref:Pimeloyl-[acyl-carrier protein] methyl ester esterase n=1 Tax=Gemmobacter megaterium TaxID=1086013 RepID=A0A1N7PT67_9RHOB|nr:alpha/beta hydrolase [Gemmobacter megaterium]GGE21192.1 pimeloyl-[acyl-carrier protein] methyl ester esterase [Gemmobacter megaterium]SIT13762.1 pimeloyl-[acyl-carrier protein] methyl ester esterase [Gemmobacter megaterium]